MTRLLVTGAAGFIGYHVALRCLSEGMHVVGLDNLNDYYDVGLKESRLARLTANSSFQFRKLDLCDQSGIDASFADYRPYRVIHLAAQAGD